jgi:hypothetical protein
MAKLEVKGNCKYKCTVFESQREVIQKLGTSSQANK